MTIEVQKFGEEFLEEFNSVLMDSVNCYVDIDEFKIRVQGDISLEVINTTISYVSEIGIEKN